MDKLKETVRNQIEEFRAVGKRFLNKEMNVAEFKKVSGGMGVYAERGGQKFMVRLKPSAGIVTREQLDKICEIAERYNLKGIHFTTRQAIQLHTLDIDDACDIMKEVLDYGIITRGGGGNYPRNISISALAGVDRDEVIDTTSIGLAVSDYVIQRILSYKLPRKIKISFSNTEKDETHAAVQDLGFVPVKKDGKVTFKVYAGGGLGMNPRTSVLVEENVDPTDLLYYVEGMLKFFAAEGDYNNKARARLRYVLERMGEEEFKSEYKKYVEMEKVNPELKLDIKETVIDKPGIKTEVKHKRLYAQKQEGLYSVYIHPLIGQLKLKDLKEICEFVKDKEDLDIRLAMVEGMYIRNLNGKEAEELLNITDKFSETLDIMQSISCVGLPICQMGRCDSESVVESVTAFLKEKGYNKDVLPRMCVSGCPNSCGIHELGGIGFMGMKVRVDGQIKDAFRLFVGGSASNGQVTLGQEKADFLPERIPEFIYKLSCKLDESNMKFEDYIVEKKDELDSLIKEYAIEQ